MIVVGPLPARVVVPFDTVTYPFAPVLRND
jgi:hypothetical protein